MSLEPEQIAQIQLFDWIRSRDDISPFAMHIPNERKCTPQHGRILKRMGVISGVSDTFIAIPKNGYFGLWIELKVGKNKPSENQIKFSDNMNLMGYLAVFCYGYEEARKAIEDYLK